MAGLLYKAAPAPGEGNAGLLLQLGYSAADIKELVKEEVIWQVYRVGVPVL